MSKNATAAVIASIHLASFLAGLQDENELSY